MTPIQQNVVHAVREHALAHYDEDGWDFVVETMDDEDILHECASSLIPAHAIARMHKLVKLWDEQRRAVRNEIF